MKTKALSVFGEAAFEHGLFYCHKESLRFELSEDGQSYLVPDREVRFHIDFRLARPAI